MIFFFTVYSIASGALGCKLEKYTIFPMIFRQTPASKKQSSTGEKTPVDHSKNTPGQTGRVSSGHLRR
jgi:hypothetical protein